MEILAIAFHLALFCLFLWVLSLIWKIRDMSDIAITRIAAGSLLLLGILSPIIFTLLFVKIVRVLSLSEACALSSVFAAFFIFSAFAVWRKWKPDALLLRISTFLIYAAVGVHVALCLTILFTSDGQSIFALLWLIFFVAPIAIPILFLFTILSIYFPPPRPQFLNIWRTPSAARLPDRLKR